MHHPLLALGEEEQYPQPQAEAEEVEQGKGGAQEVKHA